MVLVTFLTRSLCGVGLEVSFHQGVGAFPGYLLLCNKLPQKSVALNTDCVVISHNSVSQEFEQGTEDNSYLLHMVPAGAGPPKVAFSLTCAMPPLA